MKCLVKYTVNLRCEASSKKEAESLLKPRVNRLKAFCVAFGFSMSTICESYVPGSGEGKKFGADYLFSYEIYRECEFRLVYTITTAVQFLADLDVFEVTNEKMELLQNED